MADPPEVPKGVFCIRNQIMKDAGEHLHCPYCFGKTREIIEGGECKEFCDFDPEQDPIAFGFAPDTSRNSCG